MGLPDYLLLFIRRNGSLKVLQELCCMAIGSTLELCQENMIMFWVMVIIEGKFKVSALFLSRGFWF
jgi:hypothetical protein